MVAPPDSGWAFELVRFAGGHPSGKGYAIVFICYLDDSDSVSSAVNTIAGYVASIEDWSRFESKVEPIFANFGVDVLHTKGLNDGDKCFKNWTRDKKQDFLAKVYGIAGECNVIGISQSRGKADHKKWAEQHPTGS